MVNIKHFMDAPEKSDGRRIWVEPIGLARDLRQMCHIEHVMTHLGPPIDLWQWFQDHPDGYEYFRGRYHEHLAASPLKPVLEELVRASMRENLTLLHHSDDPQHNTATALYEFLSELRAYVANE